MALHVEQLPHSTTLPMQQKIFFLPVASEERGHIQTIHAGYLFLPKEGVHVDCQDGLMSVVK